MDLQAVLDIAKQVIQEQYGCSLNGAEIAVLRGSWYGKSYKQIGSENGFSAAYLRNCAHPLFNLLGHRFSLELTKNNFREELSRISVLPQIWEMRDSPDMGQFFGREEEVTILQRCIDAGTNVIVVTGFPGIGKTTLVRNVVETFKAQFNGIWCSINKGESLTSVLETWSKAFGSPVTKESLKSRLVNEFLPVFTQDSYLLVIDDFQYLNPIDSDIEDFIKIFATKNHRSCLLLLANDQIKNINHLVCPGMIDVFPLRGLDLEAAYQLLLSQGFDQTQEKELNRLITLSSHNPFALKFISQYLKTVFGGNVSEFLEKGTWIFADPMFRHLKGQYNDMPALEKRLIQCFIDRKVVSLQDFQEVIETESNSELLQCVFDLLSKHWIERVDSSQQSIPCYQAPFLLTKALAKISA